MRYFIIVFLIMILAIQGAVFILFTAAGNDLILPQVNRYFQSNTKKYDIEITGFRLGLHTLDFTANINQTMHLRAKGQIDLLAQTYDMHYTLEADELRTQSVVIDEKIRLQGEAIKRNDTIHLTGEGTAFESYVSFDLSKEGDLFKDIKAKVNKAKVSKVLAVLHYDTYADGLISLDVDMPTFDPESPQGKAQLSLHNIVLDTDKIEQDFHVALPKEMLLAGEMQVKSDVSTYKVAGSLQSNIGKFNLNNGEYDPQLQKISGVYLLDIKDLSLLRSTFQRDTQGRFELSGKFVKERDSLDISGTSASFEGLSRFTYRDDVLDIIFKNIRTKTMLSKIGENPYIDGQATGNVHFNSLKESIGHFDMKLQGDVDTKAVKEKSKTDLGKAFYLDGDIKGEIKDKKLFSKFVLDTTMAKISSKRLVYDAKSKRLEADYVIQIPDLQKLEPLTKRALNGDMLIEGNVTKHTDLVIRGEGKEFDGKLNFVLYNDDLSAKLTGATASKVMFMFGYPQVIEAISQAKMEYDVKKRKGWARGTLDNAKILPSQLTYLLENYANMNLTHQRFNNSTFYATIEEKIIHFSLDARNKRNFIKVREGFLDRSNDEVRAKIDVKVEEKDLLASLEGTLDDPKVSLESSVYLKEKINKKLDDLIDKNIKGDSAQQLKGLLKGFL